MLETESNYARAQTRNGQYGLIAIDTKQGNEILQH